MSQLRVETGFLQGGIYGAVGASGSLYCILKTKLSLKTICMHNFGKNKKNGDFCSSTDMVPDE